MTKRLNVKLITKIIISETAHNMYEPTVKTIPGNVVIAAVGKAQILAVCHEISLPTIINIKDEFDIINFRVNNYGALCQKPSILKHKDISAERNQSYESLNIKTAWVNEKRRHLQFRKQTYYWR